MRWTVNDQDPKLNKVKYDISPDSSTLTVKNLNERDKGESHLVRSMISYMLTVHVRSRLKLFDKYAFVLAGPKVWSVCLCLQDMLPLYLNIIKT